MKTLAADSEKRSVTSRGMLRDSWKSVNELEEAEKHVCFTTELNHFEVLSLDCYDR